MTAKVHCPKCRGTEFEVVVSQTADVVYDDDGDHEVNDVYGDIEFNDESVATCKAVGCDWHGQLKDLK